MIKSKEKTKLDINFVRSKFPTFQDHTCKDWSFFENAGGSYVPQSVITELTNFMISTKVQPYAEYTMSKLAGKKMDKALNLFAKMINANNKEIIIGPSTTSNLYVLSNALKNSLKKGDEIIVTNQDHEANISPWIKLKQLGIKIVEWKFRKDYELNIDDLKKLISKKTRILAVTHCSNIIGTINNLKEICHIAHNQNIIVVGDGVSYAPHGFPDVKEIGVDFYTFSLYKTYGPHIALLYGKEEYLKKLSNQNHEFLEGNYPYTINPGGPNHEELASCIGIYNYFMDLYNHHFMDKNISVKNKIYKVNNLISEYEEIIANPLLEYLSRRKDLTLFGKKNIANKNRAPTVSFISKRRSSKYISDELIKNKIATRNDNFYAWRCLKSLGVDTEDGVVRLSMTHYNSVEDTNKLIKALDKIN